MIDQRGTFTNNPISHPMEHLQILLGECLDRHKAHRGTRCGFINCFSIDSVVLGAFYEGFDETRVDQANSTPMGLKLTSPVVGAGTCFHGHNCRVQALHGLKEFCPAELAGNDLTVSSDPVDMK